MRKPSRGTVIMWITAPVTGFFLLWYVVFPIADGQKPLHDFLTWKSDIYMDYSDDGYTTATEEDAGTAFDGLPSGVAPEHNNTASSSSSSGSGRSGVREGGGETTYKVSHDQSAVPNSYERSGAVANNTSGKHNNVSNDDGTGRSAGDAKADADRLANIASVAESMRRSGEQIRKIKKGKDDQSKTTTGGSGGFLLLPPDDSDPVDVPLDGGLSVLIGGTLAYGLRKTGILRRRTVKDTEES